MVKLPSVPGARARTPRRRMTRLPGPGDVPGAPPGKRLQPLTAPDLTGPGRALEGLGGTIQQVSATFLKRKEREDAQKQQDAQARIISNLLGIIDFVLRRENDEAEASKPKPPDPNASAEPPEALGDVRRFLERTGRKPLPLRPPPPTLRFNDRRSI